MAALFDEIVALLASRVTVRSISEEFPGADVPSLGTAAVLGVPAIVARLSDSLGDQDVSQLVLGHLRGIDPASVTAAGSNSDPNTNRSIGSDVTGAIFGNGGQDRLADAVASETNISNQHAAAVLPTSAWAVLASVSRRYGNQLDNTSLTAILARERQDLLTKGWSKWIEDVAPTTGQLAPAPPAASPPAASPPPVEPRQATTTRPIERPNPAATLGTAGLGAAAAGAAAGLGSDHVDQTTQSFADPRDLDPRDLDPRDLDPRDLDAQSLNSADLGSGGRSAQGLETLRSDPFGEEHPATDRRQPATYDNDASHRGGPRSTAAAAGGAALADARVDDDWEQQAATNTERGRERPSNKRGGIISLIAGALLMLLALVAIGWLQSRGDTDNGDGTELSTTDGDDATDEASGDGTTDDGAQDTDTETATGTDDAAGEGGAATDGDTAGGVDPGDQQLSYSITMDDPLQRADANGTVSLEFDTVASQVCYDVQATGIGEPYDGHIHVGPAGVKGGIVVDFGPVSNGQPGCTEVAANDLNAILSQPGTHYVEMHDPSGDFTIRAQMSDELPPPPPAGDAAFDPEGNGASTKISDGQILLEGPVPDQETIDRMIAEVAGLDESKVLVVNDLVITEGADLPTGLITVSDSVLFEVDSDQLGTGNAVIDDLALLFNARSDWTMTIVGHTDSVGEDVYNLELSLRRAAAVRDALVELGVPAERLRTEGLGARDPVFTNDSEEGRAQNRRIEFRIDRS